MQNYQALKAPRKRISFIRCSIVLLQISWVRQVDWHILTVGNYTYTRDIRFKSKFQSQSHWTLEIKFSKMSDAGIYVCQVSSEPKISKKISLSVIGKHNNNVIYYLHSMLHSSSCSSSSLHSSIGDIFGDCHFS